MGSAINDPLLPSYSAVDKQSAEMGNNGPFDEAHTTLQVGRTKPNKAGVKVKKGLIALGLGWLAISGVKHTAHHFWKHHHHGEDFGLHWDDLDRPWLEPQPELLTTVSAVYGSTNTITLQGTTYYTANASFPLDIDRFVSVDVKNNDARVVISRSHDVEASMIVESAWFGDREDEVALASGDASQYLAINSAADSVHVIHLLLPSNTNVVRSLELSSPSLTLHLAPSAEEVTFDALTVRSEGAVDLSKIIANDLHIETNVGDINGTYTVGRYLVLRTSIGSVYANVSIVAPPHPPPPHGHEGCKGHRGDSGSRRRWMETSQTEIEDDWELVDVKGPSSIDISHPHGPAPGHDHGSHHGPDHDHPHPPPPPPHRGPHGHPPPPPHRGPHGPPPHGPPHHHGPPPARITVTTGTGSVYLGIISQPANVSSVVRAYANIGSVYVHHAKSFEGFFKASAHIGNITVTTVGEKEVKVIREGATTTGGFVKGFVKLNKGNATEELPTNGEAEGSQDLEGFKGGDSRTHPPFPPGPKPPHGPPHRGPPGPRGPHDHDDHRKPPPGDHHGPPPHFSAVLTGANIGSVHLVL